MVHGAERRRRVEENERDEALAELSDSVNASRAVSVECAF